MDDKTLIRLASESASILDEMPPHEGCGPLVGSYNAILAAAKANHPDLAFFQAMTSIERLENKYQLQILLTQLQIVLEAVQDEARPAAK